MAQFETIATKMISEYCDLVNKYSTAGYSSIIKKLFKKITYSKNFNNNAIIFQESAKYYKK